MQLLLENSDVRWTTRERFLPSHSASVGTKSYIACLYVLKSTSSFLMSMLTKKMAVMRMILMRATTILMSLRGDPRRLVKTPGIDQLLIRIRLPAYTSL